MIVLSREPRIIVAPAVPASGAGGMDVADVADVAEIAEIVDAAGRAPCGAGSGFSQLTARARPRPSAATSGRAAGSLASAHWTTASTAAGSPGTRARSDGTGALWWRV